MHESKKSDLAVVAVKPTNKAGGISAAEPVEPRAGTEGNVGQQSTHRTQIRVRVSQALERVREAAKARKKERFLVLPIALMAEMSVYQRGQAGTIVKVVSLANYITFLKE